MAGGDTFAEKAGKEVSGGVGGNEPAPPSLVQELGGRAARLSPRRHLLLELCCPPLAAVGTASVPPGVRSYRAPPPGTQALGPPACKSALGPPAHCQQGQHEDPACRVPEAGPHAALRSPSKPALRGRSLCTPPLGACERRLRGVLRSGPSAPRRGAPGPAPRGEAESCPGLGDSARPSLHTSRREMPGMTRATSTCPQPLEATLPSVTCQDAKAGGGKGPHGAGCWRAGAEPGGPPPAASAVD